MRRLLGLAAAGLLLLSVAPAAAAAAPVAVDPATLTPPPNPNFDWTCVTRGHGIVCDGIEVIGAVDGSSPDFACDGNPILVTFTQTVTARRSHDASGRVTRNHMIGSFDERWRLEGSDTVLTSRGRWTLTVDYAVPGDVTSRTNTYTGNTLTVSAPGEGVIFKNVGRVKLNWDESEVLATSGHQDLAEDFEGSIAAACAVFAG